jgi:phosphate transport system permease protein
MSTLSKGATSQGLRARHRIGTIWQGIFRISTLVGIVCLAALLYNIADSAFGLVVVEYTIQPEELARDGTPLEDQSPEQLLLTFQDNVSKGLFRRFEVDGAFQDPSTLELQDLIFEWVLEPRVVEGWGFWESLLNGKEIRSQAAADFPEGRVEMRSWLNPNFIVSPQSETAIKAGVRTAILGSLWTITIAILFAFPIGVGAAIYLEEYADDSLINRIIQTNINNLAGVPSIIYGMLGLAIFVRNLERFTSGAIFGLLEDPTTANGRTVLSAGLTLGLLVLPLVIINSQEAIRAVPHSLRQASYGLGATRWQTIWHHVLPNALSGILTGTILSISRAIGETAPLVVVGASTFIQEDPTGPFSKFTTLPIQIYQWTARPQDVFRNIAAAAILVLLVILLSLNATAILLRNRYARKQ